MFFFWLEYKGALALQHGGVEDRDVNTTEHINAMRSWMCHTTCLKTERGWMFKALLMINACHIIISGHLCHEEPQRCIHIFLSLLWDGIVPGKPRLTERVPPQVPRWKRLLSLFDIQHLFLIQHTGTLNLTLFYKPATVIYLLTRFKMGQTSVQWLYTGWLRLSFLSQSCLAHGLIM